MKKIIIPLLLPLCIQALEEKPWFGNVYEVEARARYAYSYFSSISNAAHPLEKTWHDHLLGLSLTAVVPENWQWEAEVELDGTSQRSFGYSSTALQGRYLWLDDICGDPISLVTGLTFRQVSRKSLEQLSTPYHARYDAELTLSLGKEWSDSGYWTHRLYGLAAFGKGTKGSSWLRGNFFYKGNASDRIQWQLFLLGYFGLGTRTEVYLVTPFDGWASIAHRSLDLGAGLKWLFQPWGALSFDYARRIYAHSYPQRSNQFVFTYELPFCPF